MQSGLFGISKRAECSFICIFLFRCYNFYQLGWGWWGSSWSQERRGGWCYYRGACSMFTMWIILQPVIICWFYMFYYLCFVWIYCRERRKPRKWLKNTGIGNSLMRRNQYGWVLTLLILSVARFFGKWWLKLSFVLWMGFFFVASQSQRCHYRGVQWILQEDFQWILGSTGIFALHYRGMPT